MLLLRLIVLFFIGGVRCETADVDVGALYKRLRADLKKDYDRNARPVLYNSNVTKVRIEMHLMSAFEIDEEHKTLSMDCYMAMRWIDHHLTWNPVEYGRIAVIQLSPNDIWIPDIFEMQKGGPISDIQQSDFSFIAVEFSGNVYWVYATLVPGRCTFDYINYPSDKAECKMIFEVWSYKVDTVDVDVGLMYLEDNPYSPKSTNPQWEMTGASAKRSVLEEQKSYPRAEFTVTLARKTPILQQHLLWISSVVVILLTLGMFWIPSDIEQKITMGCVVILIMTAVLLTVTSSISAQQPMLMIARTIHNMMYATFAAIMLEIIAVNILNIQGSKPPEFLLNIFSGKVGQILLIYSSQQERPSLDKMKLSEDEEGDVNGEQSIPAGNWKTISQALDRIAFLSYIVILIAIPKMP